MPRTKIVNPILRGFNPDPSICRVGDDFYVATSTFEWYPGVQIHHSRDLRNWQLIARPLDRASLLNLLGAPDSCGVWAPCLRWSHGQFWLAYTDVKRLDGNFKDTHNYLTTAADINGPWSEPVYLNSSGFDPSFYHAADGRHWYLNMVWDHRPDRTFFMGIVMQEYDGAARRLVGEPQHIFSGTQLGYTEAPHIHRLGEYFYLLTAEGGTGYGHAMTVARSKNLHGPYQADPHGPLLTSRDHADWPLQRAGHGDIVALPDGSLYAVFLCSRLVGAARHSPMGRETAIAPVEISADGWLRLPFPDRRPRVRIDAPDLPSVDVVPLPEHDDFDETTLGIAYQWLRTPWPEEFFSLTVRPGHLRLYGMESPGSRHRQALIARRQTDGVCVAETSVEFDPVNFQQLAGLILYYNSSKFHYLYISSDQDKGKHIAIMSCEANMAMDTTYPMHDARIAVAQDGPVGLRMRLDHHIVTCQWRVGEGAWSDIPVALDMRFLTDQAGLDSGEQFTGTFVGVCAHDVSGRRAVADFDYLSLRPGGGGATD